MFKKIVFSAFVISIGLSCFGQTKAKFYTTKGDFVVYLEDTLSPITAGNFIKLVNEKYYDGVLFHRVIDNFMIQGGRGATKPAIQDEFITGLSNVKGTISMANAGPNSGTTQFFINLIDNTRLDWDKAPSTSKHPVFGHVVEGFPVVQTIGKVPTTGRTGNPADKPLTDVVMDSVRIVIPEPPSSVNSLNAQKISLNVYPNPARDNLSVYTNGSLPYRIELIDVTGKVVLEDQLLEKGGNQIDISNLKDGLYVLRANYADSYITKRIVIRR